ncbi:MAG TPA: TIGR03560 family F420-dependent LLM class oxidoreductase, partial [Solirubrobacterales bacterium]|nr:TIGR03560 family F420-dependent LLM class oxidoreductase [Solirubrobacterales bacterium]
MELALMIEGQEDVTWEDWVALAGACEANGVGTMFRSDHYLSVKDRRERGALDAWATIAALAAVTEELRLGTMVSPATFRHPAVLAKMVVTADHVSGGRVELGLGAGWWEREHEVYGFELPPIGPRMDALEEQLQVVRGHWGPGPFDFDGEHYSAVALDARPKPVQQPHPPLILGGRGGKRSLRLAARYADEYNTVMSTVDEVRDIRARLDAACEAEGRDPASLPFSTMTGWLVGADREELRQRAARLSEWSGEDGDGDAFLAALEESTIQGTVAEAVEQLQA